MLGREKRHLLLPLASRWPLIFLPFLWAFSYQAVVTPRQQFLLVTTVNYSFSTTCRVNLIKFPSDTSTRMCPSGRCRVLATSCSAGTISQISRCSSKFPDNQSSVNYTVARAEDFEHSCYPFHMKANNHLPHYPKGFKKNTLAMLTCWSGVERPIWHHRCNHSNILVKITAVYGFVPKSIR